MADEEEKTEQPTPKKIQDARSKGNVPKSQDVAGIVTLLVAVLIFILLFKYIKNHIFNLTRYFINMIGMPIDMDSAITLAIVSAKEVFLIDFKG